jgi:hypothetical protein
VNPLLPKGGEISGRICFFNDELIHKIRE